MGFFDFLIDLFSSKNKDEKHYETGMQLMSNNDFSKATYEFIEALKIKPVEVKYYEAYGKSLFKRELVTEAEAAFGIADDLKQISQNPKDTKALCRLATAFQNKKQLQLSQKYLQRAVAADPNDAEVLCSIGRSNYLMNKLKEAMTYYDKVISSDPYNTNGYKGLIDICSAQGKKKRKREFEELVLYLNKAKESSGDAGCHADLGEIFYKYRNKDLAESEFNEAVKLEPKCEKAIRGIGIIKYQNGDYKSAKDSFTKAIKIKKFDPTPHSYLGMIYKMSEKTRDLANWEIEFAKMLNTLEKAEDKAKTYTGIGDFLFESDRKEYAEAAYSEALKISPKNPNLYVKLGLLYSSIDKRKEAFEYCDKAIEMAPEQDIGYLGKGRIYLEMEDNDKAITLLQKGMEYAEKNPEIHKYLGEAYNNKGLSKLSDKEFRIVASLESGGQEVI